MSSAEFSLNKLKAIPTILKDVSEASLKEMADVAQKYAVDHVQVLTGATQDSINTTIEGDTVIVHAGGASPFLEYGTVHARAFPFLRPAVAAAEQAMSGSDLKAAFEISVSKNV